MVKVINNLKNEFTSIPIMFFSPLKKYSNCIKDEKITIVDIVWYFSVPLMASVPKESIYSSFTKNKIFSKLVSFLNSISLGLS
jgi:hypothetical protein